MLFLFSCFPDCFRILFSKQQSFHLILWVIYILFLPVSCTVVSALLDVFHTLFLIYILFLFFPILTLTFSFFLQNCFISAHPKCLILSLYLSSYLPVLGPSLQYTNWRAELLPSSSSALYGTRSIVHQVNLQQGFLIQVYTHIPVGEVN